MDNFCNLQIYLQLADIDACIHLAKVYNEI